MAIIRKTLSDARAQPYRFTPEEQARLEAMSDDEIERNADSDPDAQPWTDEQLDQAVFARAVRRTRERLGLSQSQFAERFHINLARLKDWEQGRFRPDSVALAYIKVIEHDPEAVARALSAA